MAQPAPIEEEIQYASTVELLEPKQLEGPAVQIPEPPPRVDDPISIAYMERKLNESGITAEEFRAYPVATNRKKGAYCFLFTTKMWKVRRDFTKDEADRYGRFNQPKGITEIWAPSNQSIDDLCMAEVVYFIEGEAKACKFKKQFPTLVCFGFGGAHNLQKDGRLISSVLAVLRPGLKVVIIFDGDIEDNFNIQYAAHQAAELLANQQVEVFLARPPSGYKGTDDFLVAEPKAAINDFVPIALHSLEVGRKQLFRKLQLTMNSEGNVVMNEDNAGRIISHMFGNGIMCDRRLGFMYEGQPISPEDIEDKALHFIQRQLLAHYPKQKINGGVRLATRIDYDLVQEVVKATVWDGEPRLDTWAKDYFPSPMPEVYIREWGRLLMTALGLRILHPGTKVDNAFVLGGEQGLRKSSFWEELGKFEGHSFYHPLVDLSKADGDGDRTQSTAFKSMVIIDLAEGVIFRKDMAQIDRVKQLVTQCEDNYRPVYSKSLQKNKRGFIFVGTTNRQDVYGDVTGTRRWLTLWVTDYIKDLDYSTKMQILAEVHAKSEALLASRWWGLNVPLEALSAELRAEHPHIKTAQALLNQQFQRDDTFSRKLLELLEDGMLAHDSNGPNGTLRWFVTAEFLAMQMSEHGIRAISMISGLMQSLIVSPTFKYKITKATSGAYKRPSPGALVWGPVKVVDYKTSAGTAQMHGWWLEQR